MKDYIIGAVLVIPLVVYMLWYSTKIDRAISESRDQSVLVGLEFTGDLELDGAIQSGGITYDR